MRRLPISIFISGKSFSIPPEQLGISGLGTPEEEDMRNSTRLCVTAPWVMSSDMDLEAQDMDCEACGVDRYL